MKLLIVIVITLTLASCASNDTKSLTVEDRRVQNHELFDGKVRSSEITKEKVAQSKSGTKFDRRDLDNMSDSEISQYKKQQFIDKADAAFESDNLDFALYSYILALVEDNQDHQLYFKIGNLHEIKNNTSLAGLAYQKALKLKPDFVMALERMGRIKLNDREYDEAKVLFKAAIDADKIRLKNSLTDSEEEIQTDYDSPFHAYTGLGVIHDLEKNHNEAINRFSEAINIRPSSASAENNLGYSQYLNQDLDSAQVHLKRAISKDKGYSKAWTNLALIYVRKELYSDAISLLIEHTDNKSSAYNTVGYICMLEGKYDKAESFFSKAIDLSPSYFEIAVENRELNRRRYSRTVYESLN